MIVRVTWLLPLVLLAGVVDTGNAAAQAGGDITIYRCTDAKGKLTLQDAPCANGQSQQTRQMLQPTDPPPRPASATPSNAPPMSSPPEPRVIIVRTPQPLYECVRPDRSVYTSDNDDGNPRWVSIWSMDGDWSPITAPGIRYNRIAPLSTTRGAAAGNDAGNGVPPPRFVTRTAPPSLPPPHPRPPHRGHGYDGGMWVRDACHALPQAEVCARLRDRREDVRRRFFNAQQTERATLNIEERGINARLSADCGGT
ncbi:MAG: DUF4124 domain-containing protein [Luteimonas sp.]